MPMALSRREVPESEPEREIPMIWFGKRFGVPVILWAALGVILIVLVIHIFSSPRTLPGHEIGMSEIVQAPDGHLLKIDHVDGKEHVNCAVTCPVCQTELKSFVRQEVAFAFDSLVVQVAYPDD